MQNLLVGYVNNFASIEINGKSIIVSYINWLNFIIKKWILKKD
jgi:hypothetical protein